MHRPPPYGMAGDGRPPPYPYGGEYYPHERRRGGNVCVRCICCCYCVLFFIVLIIAAITLYLFTVYDPKAPIYKFEALDVKEFGYNDSNINADLILTLKADNPNKAIGFIYGEGSSVNVTYSDSNICTGKLPSFHQGQKNTTIFQIELTGKSTFGSGLYEAFQENEKNGKIPLKVMIKVPVQIILGDIKLKQFNVFANVTLTVHDLKPGKKPEVEHSKPTFDVKF
ncbi:NDR1/HIN1-like protein 6 [Solanum verrucosum]|uniref:NDR1/HIN1-like protein 6 n=1 Tax=Solanum verrucosum TaxID=315347 RepID=UPI0020D12606|nr:NDR1/HIN1-like protein 6 [Solanum verrucosum]XP_049415253.1 NDR1/HIN1-like protein 6 [Solanum stenotomum]